MALIIALVIGVPLGILSAISRNSVIDLFARLFALLGLAMPNFLLGTLIIFVLSVYFHYLPNSGNYVSLWENPGLNLQQMIFPAITLGFAFSASVMRTTRSAMLEILGQDYMRTARSKGLSERDGRHAPRPAQRPDPGHHDHRRRAGLSARRHGHHRGNLLAAGDRAAGFQRHLPARLRAGAGRRAVRRLQFRRRKSGGRCHLHRC